MWLIDSNIIIYATQPQYSALREWLGVQSNAYVSAITHIEVLGYHKLKVTEQQALARLLDSFETIFLSPDVTRRAIQLRHQYNMLLGDAVIAATAIEHKLRLATANTKDFLKIENLDVINPVAEVKY